MRLWQADPYKRPLVDAAGAAVATFLTLGMCAASPGANGAPVMLTGTSSADVLDASASSQAHIISGLAGADRIFGSSSDDVLDGGSGNDSIDAGPGADTVIGGAGNDTLAGNAGDDDFFVAGWSAWDSIDGGEGHDRLIGSTADDVFGIRALIGVEVIDGGQGFDRIRMAGGAASRLDLSNTTVLGIELIEGSSSKDTIIGSPGADLIDGGRGDDYIHGGPGLDVVNYPAEFGLYSVQNNSDGSITVRDTTTGGYGVDTLVSIERIQFRDGYFQSGYFTPTGSDNTAPVAGPDAATLPEDSTVVIDVLGNDQDVDGDPITVVAVTSPQHGKAVLAVGNKISYTPSPDFNGIDSFRYTISDGRTGTAIGNVSITVQPAPDAPRPQDDTASVRAGISTAVDVLANDMEVDGEKLTINSVTNPSHGIATITTSGQILYAPDADYQGTDSFTYSVSDPTGLTATARVTLDVRSVSSADPLRARIASAPEGSWLRINQNRFQDVWPTSSQLPATPSYLNPAKVIFCWSSMAWDPNRNHLIFWGGGHGNYSGNEVYRFDANQFQWERASLPSDVVNLLGDNQYFAVDGPLNAPTSSHTYDNQEFLPNLDRFITFGGAKFNARQQFVLEDGMTRTGPYLWDPSRAGEDAVGGTQGSQVRPGLFPSVSGGQMWENRNTVAVAGIADVRPSGDWVNSTSAYVNVDGKDAVLITEAPRTRARLFLYTINSLEDPSLDSWELVGTDSVGYGNQGAGAYDPHRKLFVRTAKTSLGWGLVVWDLTSPGASNKSFVVIPRDAQGAPIVTALHGMDFDQSRGVFVLWDGGPRVWQVRAPEDPRSEAWETIAPGVLQTAEMPSQDDGTLFASNKYKPQQGVLGKWKYAPDYDVFFGVINPTDGNVWVYKPPNWSPKDE